MQVKNIHQLATNGRAFPSWGMRLKIYTADEQGNVTGYAYGGQVFRRSPRFMKGGHTYRIRPENPMAVAALVAHEAGLLTTPLTPEELNADLGKEILKEIWPAIEHRFPGLASPRAEKDDQLAPSAMDGWSFLVDQRLCEELGEVRTAPSARTNGHAPTNDGPNQDAILKRVQELRARANANGRTATAKK